MRRFAALCAAGAVTLAAAMFFGAGPAGAQITSCTSQTASPAAVSAGTIFSGDQLVVTGGGFEANTVLSVGLSQPPVILATVATNTNGDYQTTITTPTTTPVGQNQIIVFGRGPNGSCHQSIALFNVAARPAPAPVVVQQPIFQPPVVQVIPTVPAPAPVVVRAPLARTGSFSATLGLTGVASLLLGGALLMVSRPVRRRFHTAS